MATSCSVGGCGTGEWAGPLPGDPSTVFGLTATPMYGGIQLTWNLPLTNGFALAYVQVFRSFDISFTNAIEINQAAGSAYFDQTQPGEPLRTKYYWVRQVSINGTPGDLVGPAMATAMPLIQQMLELLADQIDNGMLAPLLRTEIGKIPLLELDLAASIQERLTDNAALQDVLDIVQTGLGTAQTLIQNETTARTGALSAVVTELDTLAAGVAGNAAAIVTEQTARVTALGALASDVTTLYAESDANQAAIVSETTARVTAMEALATSIEELVAASGGTEEMSAALISEATTRAAADSALASDITTLQARTTTAESDIVSANTARVAGDAANADSITTLQSFTNTKGKIIYSSAEPAVGDRLAQNLWIDTTESTNKPKRWDGTAWVVMTDKTASDALAQAVSTSAVLSTNYYTRTQVDSAVAGAQTTAQSYSDGNLASAQTTLQTNINTLGGVLTAIGARYTAVVDVNGLVGGFGVYNDGSSVEAGFNVDTFWVGRTTNKVKPFIISGGVVYINEAAIGKLSANAVDTRGLTVRDLSGNVLLGAGVPLQIDYVPGAALNSNVSLSPDGTLNGAGGGQVTRQPVIDAGPGGNPGQRGRDDPPVEFAVGRTLQFKETAALGLPGGLPTYCTLETIKQYGDSSGGGIVQYAFSNDKTYRRMLANPAAANWSSAVWVQDLDRNAYTGDLNATNDLVLVAGTYMGINGNTATKTSGTNEWQGQVVSKEGYVGGAYVSAVIPNATNIVVAFGLNTDPLTDANYTGIDYAWYVDGPTCWPMRSGTTSFGSFALSAEDALSVIFDGSRVNWMQNGTVRYSFTLPTPLTSQLFLDTSFWRVGSSLKNIRFGPLSSNQWSAVGGPGRPADNATVGATVGSDLSGTFNQLTWDAIMGGAYIKLAHINTATIGRLSALTTETGTLTVDATGHIKGGQTSWNTGSGFFMGYESGSYKFSFGSSSGARMTFNAGTGEMQLALATSQLTWLGIVKPLAPITAFAFRRATTDTILTSTAAMRLTSDGLIQVQINGGSWVTRDNWFSPQTTNAGGTPGNVAFYVRASRKSASDPFPSGSALNTWLPMDSGSLQSWSVSASGNNSAGANITTVDLLIEISNSATGNPVVTSGSMTLTAEVDGLA